MTAKDSAAVLRMRLFGIPSSSGASGNTNRDVALVEAIHTQTALALGDTAQAAATAARKPLQVEAYASALSQGARALSASGHAAAMAAVVGDVSPKDNNTVVKIPKKKSAATTTTTTTSTTTTATAAGSGVVPPLFCPIPVKARVVVAASTPTVQDRKKKKRAVVSSSDEEDTIDVDDVQRERAYAQAEEQTKRRLTPPAKKAKYTPLVLATPARVLAELDQTNPWVAAANQVLAAAAAAAPAAAEAVSVVLLWPLLPRRSRRSLRMRSRRPPPRSSSATRRRASSPARSTTS